MSMIFVKYKHMQLLLIILLIIPALISCSSFPGNNKEPLAKVYNNYLYREDLVGIFPANISVTDSIKMAKNYIDKWIRDQLLLRLAERNLPTEEQDLEKKIADFRASLLIHKYQQYLLNERLDSIVSAREIEAYYLDHANNFILERPVIRGFFIKVSLDAPDRNNLLAWFRSGNDYRHLEEYSTRHSITHAWFSDNYLYLDDVLRELPPGSYNRANAGNMDHIAATDSEFYYLIGIQEYIPARSPMPLSVASHKIRSIILNKRKFQFLNELENNVLNEGLDKNAFQYF